MRLWREGAGVRVMPSGPLVLRLSKHERGETQAHTPHRFDYPLPDPYNADP